MVEGWLAAGDYEGFGVLRFWRVALRPTRTPAGCGCLDGCIGVCKGWVLAVAAPAAAPAPVPSHHRQTQRTANLELERTRGIRLFN